THVTPVIPPPLPPPIIQKAPIPVHTVSTTTLQPTPPPLPARPPTIPQPPTPAPAPKRESFEMRLGTYWFVRIGIVMVLTAMVFLGNYAYQHYIGLLGPWGKLVMMYLASA